MPNPDESMRFSRWVDVTLKDLWYLRGATVCGNELARSVGGKLKPMKGTLNASVYNPTNAQFTTSVRTSIQHDADFSLVITPKNQ
jgi:hypothetical protein